MKKRYLWALVPLLGATTASPGVVFHIQTTLHSGGTTTVDTLEVRIEGPNIAMPAGPSGTGMIFRGDQGENGQVYVVSHEQSSYMVIDESFVKGVGSQMSAAMAQMDEMLANLPKEQREAIERARAQSGGAMPGGAGMPSAAHAAHASELETRATGERDTMHGFPVEKHEVFRGDVKVREIWTTDWSRVDGGAEAAAAFERMASFFAEVMSAMPSMPGAPMDNPLEAGQWDRGFPVLTRELAADGSVTAESEFISNEQRSLPASDFEPPSNYRRQDPMGGR